MEFQPVIAQMLELVDQDFKIAFISLLKNVKENVLVIPQHRIRNYKQVPSGKLDLQNRVSEI